MTCVVTRQAVVRESVRHAVTTMCLVCVCVCVCAGLTEDNTNFGPIPAPFRFPPPTLWLLWHLWHACFNAFCSVLDTSDTVGTRCAPEGTRYSVHGAVVRGIFSTQQNSEVSAPSTCGCGRPPARPPLAPTVHCRARLRCGKGSRSLCS